MALGRDVAVAGQQTTQVVKYHGDLRHESTLVLTESSYFRRLDFESAMDVKFRADLLGRSVLFMGYSFRDINIRLIWFKLNQMMEDIPTADRRQSYIVRLEPNPVLEELYEAVGLKTIVLDAPPANDGRRGSWNPFMSRRPTTNLATFLADLASSARPDSGSIPGSDLAPFVTAVLVERAERECDRYEKQDTEDHQIYFRTAGPAVLEDIFTRRVPDSLKIRVDAFYPRALKLPLRSWSVISQAILHEQVAGPSAVVTASIVNVLAGHMNGARLTDDFRIRLLELPEINWKYVWLSTISATEGSRILDLLEREVEWNMDGNADDDIAFLAYLAKRVELGGLIDADSPESKSLEGKAKALLDRVSELYPSIANVAISGTSPSLAVLLSDIKTRRESLPDQEDLIENFDPGLGLDF